VLLRPQGFGQQVRYLEALNQPAFRSGFVSEGTVARLTEREIRAITPMKLSPVKAGGELTWLSENAPKITQLKQVKGKDFDHFLKTTFKDQNLSETQIRRLLNYSGFETYSKPIGLPNDFMVEFAKKNGGMVYRLVGSTNNQNLIVRVCPGLAKESVVSSYINGGVKHGTLRQQTPYVVQRNGKEFLRTDGTWTDIAKDPATHLPLETYQFKGWE
jgi:NADH:ubiquinone oxidoreductase subunit C